MERVRAVMGAVGRFIRRWAPRVLRVLLVLAVLAIGFMAMVAIIVLRRQGDLPALGPVWARVVALAVLGVLACSVWRIPRRQVVALGDALEARDRGALEDRFRRTLLALACLVLLMIGVSTAREAVAERQRGVAAERYVRAVELLDSEAMLRRLAGVYALDAVAAGSAALREASLQTVQAFVQQRVAAAVDSQPPAADVVAAVKVIAGRPVDRAGWPVMRPDFRGANLRGIALIGAQLDNADLRGAHFEGADLSGARIAGTGGSDLRGIRLDSARLVAAHLDGARLTDGAVLVRANLRNADLDGASLRDADLRWARLDSAGLAGASLRGARLDSASLKQADLAGAVLEGATLTGADFAGADLQNAKLKGTDLSAARNLTSTQLARARTDSTTILPPGMVLPPRRP